MQRDVRAFLRRQPADPADHRRIGKVEALPCIGPPQRSSTGRKDIGHQVYLPRIYSGCPNAIGDRTGHGNHRVEAPQRQTLKPLVKPPSRGGIDEAMAGADNGDSFPPGNSAVYDIGAEAVGMHDVGTIAAAKLTNGAPLADVVPVTDTNNGSAHAVGLERVREWMTTLIRRDDGGNTHRVSTASMPIGERAQNALEATERSGSNHVQNGKGGIQLKLSAGG